VHFPRPGRADFKNGKRRKRITIFRLAGRWAAGTAELYGLSPNKAALKIFGEDHARRCYLLLYQLVMITTKTGFVGAANIIV
jgi:hypothetical protein